MSKERSVTGLINYSRRGTPRPKYHANDTTGDELFFDPRSVIIRNRRDDASPPCWENEGFQLVDAPSQIKDWGDNQSVEAHFRAEYEALLKDVSGADRIVITAPPVRRFGEKSSLSGLLDNSRPARFIHVDVSEKTAHQFAHQHCAEHKIYTRFVQFNVWRVTSQPPQDVPLTLCDGRTLDKADLIPADAIFDDAGREIWRFEGLVIGYNPSHEWSYFKNMTPDEAIVFVTHDSCDTGAKYVPHSAFDHPDVPDDVSPRASVEVRAIAYWFE